MEAIGKNPTKMNIAGLLHIFSWLETILGMFEFPDDISMTSCRLKVKIRRITRKRKEKLQCDILRDKSALKGKTA